MPRDRRPPPLLLLVAPALTAVAMLGTLLSDQSSLLPRWLTVVALPGCLALIAAVLLQRSRAGRRHRED